MQPRTVRRALLFASVMLAPIVLAGCSAPIIGKHALLIAVSSPKEGGGVSIFAVRQGSGIGAPATAEYDIRGNGGKVIYPPGGAGAVFDVPKDGAVVFVPYSLFVVGNGLYEAHVRYDDQELVSRFEVQKWVNYVFLHPFDQGSKITVDVQLSRTTGGSPDDRVLTEGDLLLDLHYRGLGDKDVLVGPTIRAQSDGSETFTRVQVPRSRFSEGQGYYSFEPVFHNHQAKGNLWVPADPTMSQRNPPWNWIYISR